MELLDRIAPRVASPIDAVVSPGDAGDRATGAAWDAVLYAVSAVVAIVISATSAAPLDRLWGRVAVFGYAAGAFGAWLLFRRKASIRTRQSWRRRCSRPSLWCRRSCTPTPG